MTPKAVVSFYSATPLTCPQPLGKIVSEAAVLGAWLFLGPIPQALTSLYLGLPARPALSHLCHLEKQSTGAQGRGQARSGTTLMETPRSGLGAYPEEAVTRARCDQQSRHFVAAGTESPPPGPPPARGASSLLMLGPSCASGHDPGSSQDGRQCGLRGGMLEKQYLFSPGPSPIAPHSCLSCLAVPAHFLLSWSRPPLFPF